MGCAPYWCCCGGEPGCSCGLICIHFVTGGSNPCNGDLNGSGDAFQAAAPDCSYSWGEGDKSFSIEDGGDGFWYATFTHATGPVVAVWKIAKTGDCPPYSSGWTLDSVTPGCSTTRTLTTSACVPTCPQHCDDCGDKTYSSSGNSDARFDGTCPMTYIGGCEWFGTLNEGTDDAVTIDATCGGLGPPTWQMVANDAFHTADAVYTRLAAVGDFCLPDGSYPRASGSVTGGTSVIA